MPRKFATSVAVNLLVVVIGLEVSVLGVFVQLVGAGELPARHPGHYLAVSPREDLHAYGGYPNLPQQLDRSMPADALTLLALPDETVRFSDSHRGFSLILVNKTSLAASFPATEGRLSIVRQALDGTGGWKPIEYMPFVWCGNSYHRVILPSGYYWTFRVPAYTGPMTTRMRFVLEGEGSRKPLYSNVFEGSIHPDQFVMEEGKRLTR